MGRIATCALLCTFAVFSTIAIITMVTGTVAPRWMVMRPLNFVEVSSGLWKVRTCVPPDSSSCTTMTYDEIWQSYLNIMKMWTMMMNQVLSAQLPTAGLQLPAADKPHALPRGAPEGGEGGIPAGIGQGLPAQLGQGLPSSLAMLSALPNGTLETLSAVMKDMPSNPKDIFQQTIGSMSPHLMSDAQRPRNLQMSFALGSLVVGSVLGFIGMILYRLRMGRFIEVLGMLSLLSAAILSLTVVAETVQVTSVFNQDFGPLIAKLINMKKSPESPVLVGIGGTLSLVNCLILLFHLTCASQNGRREQKRDISMLDDLTGMKYRDDKEPLLDGEEVNMELPPAYSDHNKP